MWHAGDVQAEGRPVNPHPISNNAGNVLMMNKLLLGLLVLVVVGLLSAVVFLAFLPPDRKSTSLNSSHVSKLRMPSSA